METANRIARLLITAVVLLTTLLIVADRAWGEELPFKTYGWVDGYGRVCTAAYEVTYHEITLCDGPIHAPVCTLEPVEKIGAYLGFDCDWPREASWDEGQTVARPGRAMPRSGCAPDPQHPDDCGLPP